MTGVTDEAARALREKIHEFIRERLEAKLAKLKPEDAEKRAELKARHEPETWLADAANRAGQLQLASHIVKPIHPDARGTNLCASRNEVALPGILETASLDKLRPNDVVGNAAALDVFAFLSLGHEGRTLLQLATENDERLLAALSDDRSRAEAWQQAFAAISHSKSPPASDTLAKQVYFPLPNGDYHLLAPLFPTSLVHEAYLSMREDRFGDGGKAARDAYRKGQGYPHGYREYPDLAIRKLGGTKPQNISQLNSERHGENWLLASLPPTWTARETQPPWNVESVFPARFGRQKRVRELTEQLRKFLETVGHSNLAIRRRRAVLVEQISDEAHQYAARLAELPPGWTADPRCRLHEAERLWLDPYGARKDEAVAEQRRRGDWAAEVCHRFGNWLNAALSSRTLRLGETEHAQWKADLMKELELFRDVLGESHD